MAASIWGARNCKALGHAIPEALLLRADEVIE